MKHYTYNVDKMYTYLRGYLVGAQMHQSLAALQFAREKHKDQTRKDGVPYIVHPLSMACYAAALQLRNDNIMATILLHDVPEDCGVDIAHLPVNDTVKKAVECMTITPFKNETKIQTKRRYFNNLLKSKEAIICKAIDRYNNLTDMRFTFTADAIAKNVAETDVLLLPVLKEAKEKWTDISDTLFVLRTNIRSVNDILREDYREDYEKWYKTYTESE